MALDFMARFIDPVCDFGLVLSLERGRSVTDRGSWLAFFASLFVARGCSTPLMAGSFCPLPKVRNQFPVSPR